MAGEDSPMTDMQASLNLALVQARLQWQDPAENRAHLGRLLEAIGEPVDVAILPETFTTGFLGDPGTAAEGMDGPTVRWMRAMAGRMGCALTGSAVISTTRGRRNRLLWVGPDGKTHYYDKRHLFDMGGEGDRYVAGRERVVFEYRGWRICPQICYDLRFPVWCRNRNDYDLLLVVANWPSPRADAWSALLKARAIENQCYVAAVNRTGVDGKGTAYPGRSVVHDALGAERLKLGDEEATSTVRIEAAALRETRERLPFLADADRFTIEA